MATITDIAIGVVARTNKLQKGFSRALGKAGGFIKKMGKLSLKLTGVGAALGAVGGALLGGRAFKQIDRLGKLSKLFGTTTADLQVFEVAAERGGTSLEVVTKAARGLTRFAFDALVNRTAETIRVWQLLGVTGKELQANMNDSAGLLFLVADKLNQMEDGAQKAALAQKLFGGRSAEFVTALKGGTPALAKIRGELERFGIILEQSGVRTVEQMNDTFDDLLRVFDGVIKQVAVALAPVLLVLFQTVKKALGSFIDSKGGLESWARFVVARVVEAALQFVAAIKLVLRQLGELQAFVASAGNLIDFLKLFSPTKLFSLGGNPVARLLAGGGGAEDPQLQEVIKLLGGVREDLGRLNFGFT